MNGRDGTTAFLTLDSKIGGQDRYNHPTVGQLFNQITDNIYTQKDREKGNNKYRHKRTRNRARKTAR